MGNEQFEYELSKISDDIYQKWQASDVEAAINHPAGEIIKWVIVEGKADKDFYPKMFDEDVFVYIGGYLKDDKLNGGAMAVKSVVSTIINKNLTQTIIGIIDRDYTDFGIQPYSEAPHIYRTDKRDLELTLMSLDSAWNAVTSLSEFNNVDTNKWELVIRKMGCYHVYNYWKFLDFHIEYKNGSIYDSSKHDICSNWESVLLNQTQICAQKSNKIVSLPPNAADLANSQFLLNGRNFCDYCRGHDALPLLAQMMVFGHYNERKLTKIMIDSVTLDDIKTLKLYQNIDSDWLKK